MIFFRLSEKRRTNLDYLCISFIIAEKACFCCPAWKGPIGSLFESLTPGSQSFAMERVCGCVLEMMVFCSRHHCSLMEEPYGSKG